MTCKNCAHYKACEDVFELSNTIHIMHSLDDSADTDCSLFQNKADFVNVVRCTNCKYCECIHDQFDNDWYFCTKSANNAEVKADDFCSYGKRKEEE